MNLATSRPLLLLLSLSLGVLAWQHVVGHTYTTAQSMHVAPIILLTSISTCTGCVLFFLGMAVTSCLRMIVPRLPWTPPPWEQLGHQGSSVSDQTCVFSIEEEGFGDATEKAAGAPKADLEDTPMSPRARHTDSKEKSKEKSKQENDIDAKAYATVGLEQAKEVSKGDGAILRRVYKGDILTMSMVWSNVYGLGVASFFLSYICTMASSLASFSFIVSTVLVCIYEAVQVIEMPLASPT